MSRSSQKPAVSKAAPCRRRHAFTLVELLVVVLILAILLAVALPLYLGAVRNSTYRVARHNMRTLANAVLAYRTQTSSLTDNPDKLVTAGIIPNLPDGPGDAQYTIITEAGSLPDGRSLEADHIAVCGEDRITRVSYKCYIPGTDSD